MVLARWHNNELEAGGGLFSLASAPIVLAVGRTMVLACWHDNKLAAGRTGVLACWRNDKLAAGQRIVLTRRCDNRVGDRADNGASALLAVLVQ